MPATVLLVALAGCGATADETDAAPRAEAAAFSDCSRWKVGDVLPSDYQSCTSDPPAAQVNIRCVSGPVLAILPDAGLYARRGHPIHSTENRAAYKRATRACQGGSENAAGAERNNHR